MTTVTILDKKRVRFANGDVLDVSGQETITYTLADGQVLTFPTEAAVSSAGAHGDVVYVEGALAHATPRLPADVADRIRRNVAEGYHALDTHLVVA